MKIVIENLFGLVLRALDATTAEDTTANNLANYN